MEISVNDKKINNNKITYDFDNKFRFYTADFLDMNKIVFTFKNKWNQVLSRYQISELEPQT